MIRRIAWGVAAIVLAGAVAFCTWGDEFLRIEPNLPVEQTDAVVVLAGGPYEDRERVLVAVDLVQAGGEAGVLVLPLRHRALEWPWFVRKYRIRGYLPEERVVIGREEGPRVASRSSPGGTYAEARKTIEIMEQLGLRSAVIVSSSYHMRRARLAFERANHNPELVFHFHPVDAFDADEDPWWLNGGYVLRVADEYVKLFAGYLFYR